MHEDTFLRLATIETEPSTTYAAPLEDFPP